jgi:hypothetical protein
VLIARVHPEILHSEGVPDVPRDDRTVWSDRYRSITNLEKHLHDNGTRIARVTRLNRACILHSQMVTVETIAASQPGLPKRKLHVASYRNLLASISRSMASAQERQP